MHKLLHVARNLFWSPVASHEAEKRRCECVLAVLFYQYDAVFWMHEALKLICDNKPTNAASKNRNSLCSHIHSCFLEIRTSPRSRFPLSIGRGRSCVLSQHLR